MPLRVRDVVSLPELGLLVRTERAGLDREVRWVATSELGDPGPYLAGAELLLTTGMRLDPLEVTGSSDYVERLVAADVAALGFGVGPVHENIPTALVEAADAAGLALLEVPLAVPFIAVSKAVSRLLAAEEYAQAARGFATQRELIRSALGSDDAAAAVLPRVARHVGGFALVLTPDGSVVQAYPQRAEVRAAELAEELARLRPRGLLASAVVAAQGDYVAIQPLGVQGRSRGFLAVGTTGPLGPVDQAVVSLAVSLLSMSMGRAEMSVLAERGVRAAAMRLLLAGRAGELPLTDLGWGQVHGSVRVVLTRGAAASEAEDRVRELLPGAAVVTGVLPDPDSELVVSVIGWQADLDGLRSAVAAGGPLLAVGLGDLADSTDPDALARSLSRARRALAAAGVGVRSYDDVGGGLDALLDPAAADAWALALLAPLESPEERADLGETLRAWLARHGQVDAAAADLGVHRHTVRHRLRRAEALLGRSLDDPGVRAELFLALSRRPARPGGASARVGRGYR